MSSSILTPVAVQNPTGNLWEHPCFGRVEYDVEAGNCREYMRETDELRTKVALVGFASSTRDQVPFGNPEWAVWGLNQLYRHIPYATRWFDIHENYDDHVVEGTDHVGWLKTCKIPVYMMQRKEEYPMSITYPIEVSMKYFGGFRHDGQFDYYTSSIAYMLALAIREGFKEIGLFGIDLVVGGEYFYQKPCVEFYLGWAAAAGIKLHIPEQSALLSQEHRYGLVSTKRDLIPQTDYIARKKRIEEKKKELEVQLAILDGAAQENAFWAHVHDIRGKGGTVPILSEEQKGSSNA
jgi:hypothetical protein